MNTFNYNGIRGLALDGTICQSQKKLLQLGTEIVVATPDCLYYWISRNEIDLSNVTYFVVDEADRLLKSGYERVMRELLLKLRPDRQTIITSTSLSHRVRRFFQSFTNDPIQVVVELIDLRTVRNVTQHLLIMEENEKIVWLNSVLNTLNQTKVLKVIMLNHK